MERFGNLGLQLRDVSLGGFFELVAVMTLTAIGTSCTFSSRFRAVTTISSLAFCFCASSDAFDS